MNEIDHLNRIPAEFRPLLNLEHLTTWTVDRQREHNSDLSTYEAAHAAFQTALRSQHIDGDRKWSARWRARKVEKHLKALVKASKNAAHASESLRIAYADHVREVAALPAQRAEKAAAKASRRKSLHNTAAKSLHKTAATMAPSPGQDEAADGEMPGRAPAEVSGGRKIRGVNDLFEKGA